MKPPQPEKIKKILKHRCGKREDPYYWMNKRGSKKVLSHIRKENKYFKFQMKPHKKLKEKLFREIKKKIPQKESTAPYLSNNYWYWVQYKKNKEYPVYLRRKLKEKKPQTLLDVNHLAKGHRYYHVGSFQVSHSHHLGAFSVDTKGRRIYTAYFKDLIKNKILKTKIKNTAGYVIWSNRDDILFYTTADPVTLRQNKVYRYCLKTKKSKLIYEEKDESFTVGVDKSLSEKFIFIQSFSTLTTEVRFIPADEPLQKFKLFKKRKRGHQYFVTDGLSHFYIRTNSKGAKNFRLDQAPIQNPKHWKTLIQHDPHIYIEDMEVFKGWIALEVRKKGVSEIGLLSRKTKKTHFIEFKKGAYFVELGDNEMYDSPHLRVEYESMTEPYRVYDYHLKTKKLKLIKKKTLPVPFDSKKYQSLSLRVKARDGAFVPVSLVYKKSLFKKGKNPCLLYGYGAYGISINPHFSTSVFSLVDRGFVYAMAHVRGGADLGHEWYEQGRGLNKKNTFYDFIDVSRFLIKKGCCHPEKLFAQGGSAGGLLMGAVLNEAPHLYRGISAHVPFVDVLTTMLDKKIPLTTGEFDEWGNPEKKKYYDYIRSYSPYDNIKKGKWPSVFVESGYFDSQVQYFEPLKWVSRLRENQEDPKNLILLSMDMDSGHSGATGRFKRLHSIAEEYAFFLQLFD